MSVITQWAEYILWIPLLFHVCALIPQLFTNYWRKSTDGISPYMLFFLFVGLNCSLPYLILLGMPLAYKATCSIMLCMVLIMIGQFITYTARPDEMPIVYAALGTGALLLAGSLTIGQWYPEHVGHTIGWISVITMATWRLPQIYWLIKRKTAVGYSLTSLLISFAAVCIELGANIVLQLPWQNLFSVGRNFIQIIIKLFLFYWYGSRQGEKTS